MIAPSLHLIRFHSRNQYLNDSQRLEDIEAAFLAKDFEVFGKITMQDSNQFHAICQDTYPPIFYLNDMSKAIIRLVHVINAHFGCIKAAYTFDAGPNAVIYTLDKVQTIISNELQLFQQRDIIYFLSFLSTVLYGTI